MGFINTTVRYINGIVSRHANILIKMVTSLPPKPSWKSLKIPFPPIKLTKGDEENRRVSIVAMRPS